MPFVPSFNSPVEAPETSFWFVFHEQRLLIRKQGDRLLIPQLKDVRQLELALIRRQFLGFLNEHPCYGAEMEEGNPVAEPFSFTGLRRLLSAFDEASVHAAGLANQLVHWNRNHQFCGRCGGLTEPKKEERARLCPRCGLVNYPRLSPAIIVAVLRDDRILLAHSTRFPAAFYSVLAGFVEPGETLEGCVKREVFEEVGVSIKGIRYFGSQPWPFPDSLMIAFTAEYAGGEIKIDPEEIRDAQWFSAHELPAVPPRISIARQLIDWFSDIRRYGERGSRDPR